MSVDTAFAYFIACCLLAISPGPDNLYVMSQSIRQGVRIGFALILGLCSGLVLHTAVVAFGAVELIERHPVAYQVIRYFGAGYLIYLAYLLFMAPAITHDEETPQHDRLTPLSAYGRGVIMNLSNPKVIIFFLSLSQPFVNPAASLRPQYLLMGLLFILATALVFGAISVFASHLGQRLKRSATAQVVFNRLCALILAGLAIYLLFSS